MHAETLSITLPVEMARVIRAKVDGGAYSSTSEVIREAMRVWINQQRQLAELDQSIERGIDAAEAGDYREVEAVRADMRRCAGAEAATSEVDG